MAGHRPADDVGHQKIIAMSGLRPMLWRLDGDSRQLLRMDSTMLRSVWGLFFLLASALVISSPASANVTVAVASDANGGKRAMRSAPAVRLAQVIRRPRRLRRRLPARVPRAVTRRAIIRSRARNWRGRYWGRVAFGVTLGAIIVVAANSIPVAPDPSLCWTWTNDGLTRGYWYYCDGD